MSPASSPTNVYIGIFARNEAERIPNLLRDLSRQTLLQDKSLIVGIAVIANGCSDDTAAVAQTIFDSPPYCQLPAEANVHILDAPGKSNAWNEFVHNIVPSSADFVFCLDADIRIPNRDSLAVVLERLQTSEQAIVAVDRSVKDLELQAPKTLSERLIKAGTGTAHDVTTAIAGALYCVKHTAIQKIWLPIGLPGEDEFLRAMLLTSSFEHEERLERLVYVPEACHVFESLRSARAVFRHNVRLAIGTAVNILLFHHLRDVKAQGLDIAEYIVSRNLKDRDWINSLIAEKLRRGYFPLEPKWLLRRLMYNPRCSSPRRAAVTLMGIFFDLTVFLKATRLMRRGAGAGYW